MKLKDIFKVFHIDNSHCCYVIDYENKTVAEMRVPDNESDPPHSVKDFPYELLGFDSPYDLIDSPDWTIISADGEIVAKDAEGYINQ